MTHPAIDAGLARSPFNGPAPRRGPTPAVVGALTVAAAVHLGLGAYLWKARFEPQHRAFVADEVTQVQLVRPAPPPPPPPPPPPKVDPPPPKPRTPSRVQPRPPKVVAAPQVPPLPIPPVERRMDIVTPPVVRISPPAPPAPTPPPPRPPVISNPDWLRRPSGAEIARYYPERAARRGVEGRATIGCRVSAAGRLEACVVLAETPSSAGFGVAALKMSRHFKLRPMTRDGVPVAGGTIRIPIRFALPD